MSDYQSRKISLPGGREIEVVYLGEVDPGVVREGWVEVPDGDVEEVLTAAFTVFDQLDAELWMCDGCGSDLVRPLAIEERDGGVWHVERECPECSWHHEGDFSRSEIEDYHDALEEGTEELLTALRQMARLNMEGDITRMIDAIDRDGIQPMDF